MSSPARMPTVYLTHGGGPCFWMEFPEPFGPHAYESLRVYLSGLIASLPAPPRAIVMVSAHWEQAVPTVSTGAAPPMLFDYYGFPAHTYRLRYTAPGAPQLADRVHRLLAGGRDPRGRQRRARLRSRRVRAHAHHRPGRAHSGAHDLARRGP